MMNKVHAVLIAVAFLLVPAAGQASSSPGSLQDQHLELLKKAKELYDQEDNSGAIAVCDEYIQKLGPDFHPQIWFLRGNAFHKIFKNTGKEVHIGSAIESYEKALALYKDVRTFTGLDSVRYQIDGMFNLGLLYEERYRLLHPAWDPQIRKEQEWKIISSISQAMSLAEMYGEWKEPIDEQRERYLDRSLQTYLDMIVRSDMPDVYVPLTQSICARGRASKQKEKYAKYEEALSFDPNIKACVHWIRGKDLAENVLAYDESIDQLRKGLGLAESQKAQSTICRQIADIYLKKDSFEDKKWAMDYAGRAWELWKKNQQEWGDRQDIFDTFGASLKAVAVGIAMKADPDYDRIIQICHQSLNIPNYGDRYYMDYLLSYASYQKGDEEMFYRHGKQAVQVILDKYANQFDKAQSEEEKEVLMFWVNSLRGSGRVLEAMRYQKMGDRGAENAM
jgi:tetratricopeptide (TPR) repeat protein